MTNQRLIDALNVLEQMHHHQQECLLSPFSPLSPTFGRDKMDLARSAAPRFQGQSGGGLQFTPIERTVAWTCPVLAPPSYHAGATLVPPRVSPACRPHLTPSRTDFAQSPVYRPRTTGAATFGGAIFFFFFFTGLSTVSGALSFCLFARWDLHGGMYSLAVCSAVHSIDSHP